MPRINLWLVGGLLLLAALTFNSWQRQRYGRWGVMSDGMRTKAGYLGGGEMAGGVAMSPAEPMMDMATTNRDTFSYEESAQAMPPGSVTAYPASSGGEGGGSGTPIDRIQQREADRFLIRNGSLTLETKDPGQVAKDIEALAGRKNGYTGELREVVDSLERKTVTLTLRVPAAEFEGVLAELQQMGKTLEKWVTSEDVTEEYVDAQARARNLRDTESRLLAHLADSKKLSDTLEVEREITRIRGELEALEGRLKYLSHRISFSTISLTIQEEAGPEPVTPAQKFSPNKEFTSAVRELVILGQGVLAQVIWLGVFSPVWLPILLLLGWAWRRVTQPRRRTLEEIAART